jgi:transposase
MWQQVRHLAALGKSRRAIARELGLSRNTVADALKRSGPPRYTRSQPSPSSTLWQEAVAAGVRRGLSGARLLEEARQRGFCDSRATFYRWLEAHKEQHRERSAACRFETDPGEQAQFDWAEYSLALGGIATKVYVYSLLLGYCRRVHWFPSLAVNQEAACEALEAGWRHFGGACRFLLVDNAKVFLNHHRGSEVRWNPNFLRLCGHYSVQPIASTPHHPQSKGKVENPFGRLEERFLVGSAWRDFDHFQAELLAFEGRWEQRVHGTTKVPPGARFEEERSVLLPLPSAPFLQLAETFRQVSKDCLISYGGVRYSVPWPYAGKPVLVRPSQGRDLVVYAQSGELLARHPLRPSGSPPAICREHYEGLRRRHLAALHTLALRFREQYAAASATAETFLQRLLAQHRHHPERPLGQVLELLSAVPPSTALAALAEAVEFNLCTPRFLEELLRRQTFQQPSPSGSASLGGGGDPPPAPVPITQLSLPELEVERSLAQYGRALVEPETTAQKGE